MDWSDLLPFWKWLRLVIFSSLVVQMNAELELSWAHLKHCTHRLDESDRSQKEVVVSIIAQCSSSFGFLILTKHGVSLCCFMGPCELDLYQQSFRRSWWDVQIACVFCTLEQNPFDRNCQCPMHPSRDWGFLYRYLDLQRFFCVESVLLCFLTLLLSKAVGELHYLGYVFFLGSWCFIYADLCFQYPVVHQKTLHAHQFWCLKTKSHFQKA